MAGETFNDARADRRGTDQRPDGDRRGHIQAPRLQELKTVLAKPPNNVTEAMARRDSRPWMLPSVENAAS